MSRLALFGIAVTLFYLAGLLFYIWSSWKLFAELEPNAWGDFLAGTIGPLALFWLVLGFFQQGQELKLQVKELQNSVTQQKELVDATNATLNLEREEAAKREMQRQKSTMPKFIVSNSGGSRDPQKIMHKIRIKNAAAHVSNVSFEMDPKPRHVEGSIPEYWERGQEAHYAFQFLEGGATVSEATLSIIFTNIDGHRFKVIYNLKPNPTGSHHLTITQRGTELQKSDVIN